MAIRRIMTCACLVLALALAGSPPVRAKMSMGLGKVTAERGVVAVQNGPIAQQDVGGVHVTLTGPGTGVVGDPSALFQITVAGSGSDPILFTMKDRGDGGTFNPSSLTLSAAAPRGTFTYVPMSPGDKYVSVINNRSLTNPAEIKLTAVNGSLPPAPTPGSDRTSQPYLFQMVRQRYPHTLPGGSDYSTDWRGPTYTYIDAYGGWKWDHPGKGDWIDLNGTPQGGTPFASFNANSGNLDEFFTYTGVDVTALVQYAQTHNRWLAVIMDISGPGYRKIATIWNQTTAVPSIAVTYADATVGTLACRVVGVDGGGSVLPHTVEDEETVPAFLEFDQPAKAVTDARLTVSLKRYFNTASNVVSINLCNPSFNTDPVTGLSGLASQAGNLDSGITGVSGVIGAQRYVDGSTISDFVYGQSVNIGAEKNYDPALWGGAQDLTKLPHTQVGKWVCGGLVENLSFVDSGYSGEGFQPLAPGLGALKLVMPDSGIQTGQEGGSSGTAASNAYLFMPFEEMGLLDHIFVRQYVRFEFPFTRTPVQRREVLQSGLPVWSDMGGKFGISPSHNVSGGGFSGTSGGGYGWQMRWAISECETNLGGPDEQGVQLGWHLYDFGPNNPPGYRGYGGQEESNWGQRGGLGAVLYGGRWYCIETEVKLNSVNAADSSWQADGVLRTWIDGRLVFERTGLVFRTLPLTPAYPANPDLMRPFRELGVGWLLWNWFNGGKTQSTVHRTAFTTGLVWAKQRIGQMKGVP